MSVNEKMTAIADAIRGKTGGTETLSLDQMAAAIAGIAGGDGSSVVLLESGEFTLAENSNSYVVELAEIPDLFACYAKEKDATTLVKETDGHILLNLPEMESFFSYESTDAKTVHINISVVVCGYDNGTDYSLVAGGSTVYSDSEGIHAALRSRSNAYLMQAQTYVWVSYKLWS